MPACPSLLPADRVLVVGGAASGKSAFAETLLAPFPLRHYIATARAEDAEMMRKIAHHRSRRGRGWQTHETPLALAETLDALPEDEAPALIECLTLWLSNLIAAKRDWREAAKHLSERLAIAPRPVVLVTNELGMGLVPALPRSRLFREAAGALNQTIACACTEIWLVVAGVPTRLGAASGRHQPR